MCSLPYSANFLFSLLSTKMSGLQCLASENIWFDKHRYDEAEKCFYEGVNGPSTQQQQVQWSLFYESGADFIWEMGAFIPPPFICALIFHPPALFQVFDTCWVHAAYQSLPHLD